MPPGQTATNGMNRPCSEARRPSRAARTGNGTGANKVRKRGSSHCKNGDREKYDSDDWDREQAESISIAPNATKTAEVFAPRRAGQPCQVDQRKADDLGCKKEFYEEKNNARAIIKSARTPSPASACLATRLNLRRAQREACDRPTCGRPAQAWCSEGQPADPSSCSRFPGDQGGQRFQSSVNVRFDPRLRNTASLCCFSYA